ncbi:MAG: type II toxin-antitoxin system RelE/ParE family toxin [Bacteroidia bacterium]|nr:type II toxin-antitoxin system RelE/ParE family toxin [Bacteroidia bacterium]
MAKEIRWTGEALSTFERVMNYLEENWTPKEIEYFVNSTDRVIRYIAQNPNMFRPSGVKGIREALITPHNLLLYKTKTNSVDILLFWDTRQHPKKKFRKKNIKKRESK